MFGDIPEKKEPSETIKTSVIESRKICVFRKGLVHGFNQKIGTSLSFFFKQNKPRKMVGYI